jgi:hypothetical protein
MNAAGLDELLSVARTRLREPVPEGESIASDCLSFARARALALNPDRWTAAERSHAAGCRRCARLLESFEREMPHLSLWTLIRRRMGALAASERHAIGYHLEEGECRRCRAREERLGTAFDGIVRLPGPVPLPHPAAAGAATEGLDVSAWSAGGLVEAELAEEEGRILLEIRTRDAAWNHHLAGYALRSDHGQENGFLVLRPDVEGWYSAQAAFDPRALYSRLGGKCEEVLAGVLDVELLTGVEWEALAASVARSRGDPGVQAAWEAWAAEVIRRGETLSEEARPFLQSLLHTPS